MKEISTICALATAPGGALAIIRISGPNAIAIVASVCRSPGASVALSPASGSLCCEVIATSAPNSIHYAHLVSPEGAVIDEVLVSVFRAPHSYTGEDSVEISCHGSSYITRKILETLIDKGCRMAAPGEYTQRAYLNGKLDLSQAEAVADLIASTNQATHHLAMSQLRGGISSELANLREQLLKMTSLMELELDFSDHEDLEFADRTELNELAKIIDKHITRLAHSFEMGQAIKQGIPVAIVGKTNVGKSTLLNQLLKDDRAIVSDIHGTTRDTIEDTMEIQGVSFRFIDTAGLRQTTDEIEQIGIERTYAAIDKARIVIWLIDTQPSPTDFKDILERIKDKYLVITQNKIDKEKTDEIDLSPMKSRCQYSFVQISAKHNQHIDRLEEVIYQAANIPTLTDSDVIVTNARHYDALQRAHQSLSRVIDGLRQGLSGDLLSEDLRDVLNILSEITGGQITPNEVLGNIFKNFCVGK